MHYHNNVDISIILILYDILNCGKYESSDNVKVLM